MVRGICEYLTAAHEQELGRWRPNTAFQGLAGVVYYHKVFAQIELPVDDYRVKLVKKGMIREYGERCVSTGKSVRQLKRKALTLEILEEGERKMELWVTNEDEMTFAALKLSYMLMARGSELLSDDQREEGVHPIYCLRSSSCQFMRRGKKVVWVERESSDRVRITFVGS
jgi:hypothetical protein